MRTYDGTILGQRGAVQVSKSNANQRVGQLRLDLPEVKPVVVSFDGGDVSGNGGVLLIAKAEKLTKLIAGAAACLEDSRTESLIKHNQREQVMQRVLQIISGYAATSDSGRLRSDPALKLAAGRNPVTGEDLASQPTQSRFENTRRGRELYRLCEWLVDYYIQCHRKRPKSLVLDFDGSAIETHGLQLHAFYRGGPYGKYMYFPLFVFDQHGWLLVAALRPGDDGEVSLSLPVLKRLVAKLRKAWPGLPITVRADGAFTDAAFYKWMDENNVKFVLGLKHNNALLTHSKAARQAAEKKFKRKFTAPRFMGKGGGKRKLAAIKEVRSTHDKATRAKGQEQLMSRRVRVFADFAYGARTWDRKRRVVCRIDFDDEGANVRYIVTNIQKFTAVQIYEGIYCKRSGVELWIKDIKETNCQRLSCSQFISNMFRLLLHALAYILLHQIRQQLPEHCRRLSIDHLRRQFINVPVQIVEDRVSVRVRVSATYFRAREFRLAAKRMGAESLIAA
jgi:hypothetical protein